MSHSQNNRGFTLIELSIVLVIIGLIVGGILVGKDLISAAQIRAQIAQIQKYQSAFNAFRAKYNCLPGDCKTAADFGFIARGPNAGQGDGNGLIEGNIGFGPGTSYGASQLAGETALLWCDLSQAGLIEGNFNTATAYTFTAPVTEYSSPKIADYMPRARIGNGNYVGVWSGYPDPYEGPYINANYFQVERIPALNGWTTGAVGLSVRQAFEIDTKIDDGMPTLGAVQAVLISGDTPGPISGTGFVDPGPAAPGTASTCFDNNNVAWTNNIYTTRINGGDNINCALAIQIK